jgi:hypothetical protein
MSGVRLSDDWNDPGWVSVPRQIIRDERLSMKALGIVTYLASHRPGFLMTREFIVGSHTDGKASIEAGLAELRALGYLTVEQARSEDGRLADGSDYVLHRVPAESNNGSTTVTPKTGTTVTVTPKNRAPGNQGAGKSATKRDQSLKRDQEIPAAVASEPALDLPEVEDELAKRRASQEGKPPTLNQRAVILAQAHYERLGKMGNVPAFVQVIRKALERNYADADVDRVLEWLADRRWTLTEERLAHALRGGPQPAGNTAPTTTRNQARTGPDGRGPILEFN